MPERNDARPDYPYGVGVLPQSSDINPPRSTVICARATNSRLASALARKAVLTGHIGTYSARNNTQQVYEPRGDFIGAIPSSEPRPSSGGYQVVQLRVPVFEPGTSMDPPARLRPRNPEGAY